MSEEMEVLREVCDRLEKAEIPYMLTGSFACNFYATPRMTRDIDIIIELEKPDIEKFNQIFLEGFYIAKESMIEAIQYQSMFNVIHNLTVIKIDFIVRKNASYRQTEFKRRKRVLYNKVPVWIVSAEDLIISKLCWAKEGSSDLQKGDIKNLLSSLPELDQEYLQRWIQELDLSALYQEVAIYA